MTSDRKTVTIIAQAGADLPDRIEDTLDQVERLHQAKGELVKFGVIIAPADLSADDLVYWTNRVNELAPGEEVQIVPKAV